MSMYEVELPDEYAASLEESFKAGPLFEMPDGRLMHFLTEETVARINGIKVEIFADEHPPPHFRVKYQSSTANFVIANCQLLNGSGEVMKYEKNIRQWWEKNKQTLIDTWDRMRPSDCPVGKYVEK
jgi:hypothetical protein